MRVLAYIVTGIVLFGSIDYACGATKCIALDSSSKCTGTSPYGKVDWTTTCNGVPLTGLGICSATAGTAQGQTTSTLATDIATDANKYCWCRIIKPVVSPFVYADTYESSGGCANVCANLCTTLAVYNTSFRAALLSKFE